jgi:hypothetical protein
MKILYSRDEFGEPFIRMAIPCCKDASQGFNNHYKLALERLPSYWDGEDFRPGTAVPVLHIAGRSKTTAKVNHCPGCGEGVNLFDCDYLEHRAEFRRQFQDSMRTITEEYK